MVYCIFWVTMYVYIYRMQLGQMNHTYFLLYHSSCFIMIIIVIIMYNVLCYYLLWFVITIPMVPMARASQAVTRTGTTTITWSWMWMNVPWLDKLEPNIRRYLQTRILHLGTGVPNLRSRPLFLVSGLCRHLPFAFHVVDVNRPTPSTLDWP